MNNRLSNDLPFEHVGSACFEGAEPAVSDQSFDWADCAFSFAHSGAGTVNEEFVHSDGRLAPPLQPVEQLLCRRGLLCFLDWCWLVRE